MNDHAEQDLKNYNSLLVLWQAENPIKTIKLQFLFATNAVLFGFLSLANSDALLLGIVGALLNVIWTLSIGRTSLFQQAWKNKLATIATRHPDDERFQILNIKDAKGLTPRWLQVLGGVSSSYYLLGAPIGMAIFWFITVLTYNR